MNGTTPARGYYSLIQYCPDRGRLEAANLGAVVLCPAKRYLGIRLSETNDRAKRFFGAESFSDGFLDSAKRNLADRLKGESPMTQEALTHFADCLGNDMQLTPPRPMAIERPEADLERIFSDYVAENPCREGAR